MKNNTRTKKIMILDVETNHEQKVFDLSYLVGDLHGNILDMKQSVIEEIYPEELFWEKKRPDYEAVMKDKSHPAKLISVKNALLELDETIQKFKIKTVYAYNAAFDTRTVNNLANEFEVNNPLKKLEIDCLWFWSAQTIFQQKNFKKWADKNFKYTMTEKGNYKTSAEIAYAYMKNEPHFEEVHRGLEDCLIEYEIFLKCRSQRKLRAKGICHNAWLLVQDDSQIAKLPPQFRTMQLNLKEQIPQVGKVIRKFNKKLNMKIENSLAV